MAPPSVVQVWAHLVDPFQLRIRNSNKRDEVANVMKQLSEAVPNAEDWQMVAGIRVVPSNIVPPASEGEGN